MSGICSMNFAAIRWGRCNSFDLTVFFLNLSVRVGVQVIGASSSNGAATWAFLDEVNTCDHMGLVTEILCHRRVLGKPLPENLVLLAACTLSKALCLHVVPLLGCTYICAAGATSIFAAGWLAGNSAWIRIKRSVTCVVYLLYLL